MNSCINLDLERVRVWLAANKLILNMKKKKTEFLLIGSKQRLLNFAANLTATINQFPIKQISTIKSLGVPPGGGGGVLPQTVNALLINQ